MNTMNIFADTQEEPKLSMLIDNAVRLLLLKDGDRDPMNHSDITCEQSMVIVRLLQRCKSMLTEANA